MFRQDVIQFLKDQLLGPRREFFANASAGGPIRIASAPGRLDVLGGLGAASGGTVAQMPLPLRAGVAVQLSPRPILAIYSHQIVPPIGNTSIGIPLGDLDNSPGLPTLPTADAWAAPILALWQVLRQAHPTAVGQGAAILIHSQIPFSAGQANSAALLAATATAICSLRGVLDSTEPSRLAGFISQAREFSAHGAPSPVGATLDAMTCLVADSSRPRIFRYSTQPFELIGQAPLPDDLRVFALDTGVRHTGARETLGELHLAGAMGLAIIDTVYRDLGQHHTPLHGYLANTSPLLYRQYFRALLPRRMRGSDFLRAFGPLGADSVSALLDPAKIYRVRTAVDHLITENEHAEQFLQAIEELTEDGSLAATDSEERQRTLQRAGRLVLASHHSYRLRLELSCREADWLVDRLMDSGPDKGIFGARITGSGGGGTVMALTDSSRAAADTLLETMQAYHKLTGLSLAIAQAGAPNSSGALLGPDYTL